MSATAFIQRRERELAEAKEASGKASGNSILELKNALEEETKKTRKRRSEPATETPQEPAAETQQEITNADS